MKSTRFQILCTDGKWRFVFCRSMNGFDALTASAVITTERRAAAYVSHGDIQPAQDLAYFEQHSHGRSVRAEQPIP